MPKADAEERPAEILHPMSDCRFFRSEPRVELVLPNVHRTAHHDQQIEIAQVRNALAGIEFDGAPFISVFPPKLTERARMLHWNMLENQNVHSCVPSIISRGKVA